MTVTARPCQTLSHTCIRMLLESPRISAASGTTARKVKMTARLMVSEPRCVDAVSFSDQRRSVFMMVSHTALASPSAGRSNCALATTSRCQNMMAPAKMITPESTSGTVNPCHSARSAPATSGKRTLRYSLIGADSTAGATPKATVQAVSTAGESHSFGLMACISRTASDCPSSHGWLLVANAP